MPLDLEAIEARAEAATPGPWISDELYVHAPVGMVADRLLEHEADDAPPNTIVRARGIGRGATDEEMVANLGFIAAARQDVPALVARVRELTGAAQCDACAGRGDNPECMCGGTGHASEAVVYLRKRVLELGAEVTQLRAESPSCLADTCGKRPVVLDHEWDEDGYGDTLILKGERGSGEILIGGGPRGAAEILRATASEVERET